MASNQVQEATSSDKQVKQPQTGAQITLTNQTPRTMTLNRSNVWVGTAYFPRNIASGMAATFKHTGVANKGASAVVVYYGTILHNLPCAWVLAWVASPETDENPNKVYVATGARSVIDSMSFKRIAKLLSQSSEDADASDLVYRIEAEAKISIGETTPEVANVTASFSST